jgi:hypothetical protein
MSDINNNTIRVRLGAENAIRVVSAVPTAKLSNLDDIDTSGGIPNNSILVYNSSTELWSPYPYIDGGTY